MPERRIHDERRQWKSERVEGQRVQLAQRGAVVWPHEAVGVVDAAVHELHTLAHRGDVHVVEHDDVAVLPGVRRPSLIGFRTDEVKRVISLDQG